MNDLKKYLLPASLIIVLVFISVTADAQCAMCSATAESAVRNGKNQAGFGLNDGILYLLATPYILFGIFGSLWYWNYRKKKKSSEQEISL